MVSPAVAFSSSLTGQELQKLGSRWLPSRGTGHPHGDPTLSSQLTWHLQQVPDAGRTRRFCFVRGVSLAACAPRNSVPTVSCALPSGGLRRSEFLSAAIAAHVLAARWHHHGQSSRWGGNGDQQGKRRMSPSAAKANFSEDSGGDTGTAVSVEHKENQSHSYEHAEHTQELSPRAPNPPPSHVLGASNQNEGGSDDGNGGYRSYKAWQIDNEGPASQKAFEWYYSSPIWGSASSDAGTFGAKEPVYQVLEVNPLGEVRKREVSRRQLLKSSGLRQRDVRRVDPSLWVTNSLPALLVRDNAILLNLGSLRAIATADSVLIFDHASLGAQTFLETLLERLRLDADASMSGAVTMPFELEVVESALISRTQRLENALMDVEPRVTRLLEQLPQKLTADALEELRISKQALVELGAKAGALRQMLLELLDLSSGDLRRMTAMSFRCRLQKKGTEVVCDLHGERPPVEEEQEEVEMLLEYYLQRCDSCHGQAEKLLDSSKEMEDSLSVNLSSRRLEVSRLELLLQVGTFAAAMGALVAGIFGMNLRSRLEEHVAAFWLMTGGILLGGVLIFLAMFQYLRQRKIL